TDRKLDRQNAHAGTIGPDFQRLGFSAKSFYDVLKALDRRNANRLTNLEDLNKWRNAVAHQDFTQVGGSALRLQLVRKWFNSCDKLTQEFDISMRDHLKSIIGMTHGRSRMRGAQA